MTPQGSILLADDEETFLEATKDLLEEEGYDCYIVHDATELTNALEASEFDLLITDLNMPGNLVMEKVSELREKAMIMPVIVVTGYPSVSTAVESIRLNVLDYMIKPINFPQLLDAVKRGIQHQGALRTLTQARRDAEGRATRLADLEETLSTFQVLVDEEASKAMIAGSHLKGLEGQIASPSQPVGMTQEIPAHVTSGIAPDPSSRIPSPTDYYRLRESIFHTIQVLQKTKSAFRSKDLAALRQNLEDVLRQTSEPLRNPPRSSTGSPDG